MNVLARHLVWHILKFAPCCCHTFLRAQALLEAKLKDFVPTTAAGQGAVASSPGASSAEVVALRQTVDDQAAKIDELEAGFGRLLALVNSGGLAAAPKTAGTCTAMHGYAAKQLRVAHPCPSIEPQLNPCRSSAVVCFLAIIE